MKTIKKSIIYEKDNAFYLPTGKESGIFVLDIDDPAAEHNKKIKQMIDALCPTLAEKTNHGYHYYFKYNKNLNSTINTKLKLDILSDGKIVFCAPTRYKANGKIIQYELLNRNPIVELHEDIYDYIMSLSCEENEIR